MTSQIDEIGLTYKSSIPISEKPTIQCPEDAYSLLLKIWDMDTILLKEEFLLLVLNNNKKCLGWSKISSGGATATIVDVSLIFQTAIIGNASSIVVAHSHPSGTLKPSSSDIRLTERIKKAGAILGVPLDDHIILTSENYMSFRQKGLL